MKYKATPAFLHAYVKGMSYTEEHNQMWGEEYYRQGRPNRDANSVMTTNGYIFDGRVYRYHEDWHKNYHHSDGSWIQVIYLGHTDQTFIVWYPPRP